LDKCAKGNTYAVRVADKTLKAPAGLLRPQDYGDAITLHRAPATGSAAHVVELYWAVAWELPPGEVRTQETLPYPSVHLVVEDGDALVYGIPRKRFTRELAGGGSVLGIKFLPGGFRPFMQASVSSLRGQVVRGADVMNVDPAPLVEAVLAAGDVQAQAAAAEAWLGKVMPPVDPRVAEAAAAVATIAADPTVVRVEELARALTTSTRSLQRLFTEYVGVPPKWVVRRFRMHEAAARAAEGPVDWAQLALDLGYFDQPHFVRDFTATVGMPPSRYAAELHT
jgi:AraC-like DNA-binding protein